MGIDTLTLDAEIESDISSLERLPAVAIADSFEQLSLEELEDTGQLELDV